MMQAFLSKFTIKQILSLLFVCSVIAFTLLTVVYFQTNRLQTLEQMKDAEQQPTGSLNELAMHRTIVKFSQRQKELLSKTNSNDITVLDDRQLLENEMQQKLENLRDFLGAAKMESNSLPLFNTAYANYLKSDTQLHGRYLNLLISLDELESLSREVEAQISSLTQGIELIITKTLESILAESTQANAVRIALRLKQDLLLLDHLLHHVFESEKRMELIEIIDDQIIPLTLQIEQYISKLEPLIMEDQGISAEVEKVRSEYMLIKEKTYRSNKSVYQLRMKSLVLLDSFRDADATSSISMQQMMTALDKVLYEVGKVNHVSVDQAYKDSLPSHEELLNISFLTTSGLSLLTLSLLPLILYRVKKPLSRLSGAFRALSEGNLHHRMDLDEMSHSEFSNIAKDFNRFAQRNQNTINKLAQSAESLDENRARIQSVLNGVPNGIITIDETGAVVSSNPAADTIFGSSKSSLVGKNMFDLISVEDRRSLRKNMLGMMPGLNSELLLSGYEITGRRMNGSEFPLRLSLTAMRLRDTQHYTVVLADITESKQAESALRKSEALFRTVSEFAPVMIAGFDACGKCILWNGELEKVLGWKHEDILKGINLLDVMYPYEEERELARRDINKHDGVFRESRPIAKNGDQKTVLWASFKLPEGEVISTGYDITERNHIEKQLLQTSIELDTILENILVGVCYIRDRKFVYANTRFQQMFGREEDSLEGLPTEKIFSSHQVFESMDEIATQNFRELKMFTQELEMKRKDGSLFWCELSCKLISDKHPEHGSIWLFEDVSQRRNADLELVRLANYDTLTGLPNRSLFHDRIQHALLHAKREKGKLSLLFLDLDNFKQVNDSLGHSVGDKLLTEVAMRLKRCIREDDTVARIGGDEFTVILEQLHASENTDMVASKILKVLDKPYQIENRELNVQASIGISVYPDDGDNSEVLLRNADTAMYHAKAKGRNNFQYFSNEMNQLAAERLELENSLRAAILNEEFILYYQPQVELGTGVISGVEALIRWNHPEKGLISPIKFIPVLEETGMILSVGEWVLEQACKDARDWLDQGLAPIQIAVNLSGHQFQGEQLTHSIARVLDRYKLDAHTLDLEITETVLMEDSQLAINTLIALGKMGTRLSIDDFGTGYSSLAYLRKFPIDTLKIDRSFVCDINTDRDDEIIIEAIVAMARRLKMDIVAEGVETFEQAVFLSKNGVERVQGYFYSKPVPAAEISVLLRQGPMKVPPRALPAKLIQASNTI